MCLFFLKRSFWILAKDSLQLCKELRHFSFISGTEVAHLLSFSFLLLLYK